jgi:sugar (pentulose or hexulose) kinase
MSGVALLAVDIGTTAIKAAVYSADGRPLSVKTAPNRALRPRPGWSEQDMDEVWRAARACIARAVAGSDAANIAAIGVCGQGDGLWALDADLRPVRNAVLWNDSRADELVLDWIQSGVSARLSRICRTSNWAGTAATIFRWLKDNEPQAAQRVERVLFCKDWINLKLTGALATDFSDASIPFLDLEARVYADEAFDLLDVAELKGKLAKPRRAVDLAGSLSPGVAAELGLRSGLPVAVGAIDLGAMMTGMRLADAGDVGLILGTTAMVNVVVAPAPFAGEPIGATICHPFEDRWIRVIAPLSGTSTLDWFASLHRASVGGGEPSEAAKRVSELAREVPPGAHGVSFLPFLAGERAPFVAPQATASFSGLKASSTLADLARAVMEGTAFSLRHCFEATGIERPESTFLTGGGARNRLWCDILANALGAEIVASDASDHGLWGIALIAAAAAGLGDVKTHPPRAEATRKHAPEPRAAAAYDSLFELYQQGVAASQRAWPSQRAVERRLETIRGSS